MENVLHEQTYQQMRTMLNEKQRRQYLAVEAKQPCTGVQYSRETIRPAALLKHVHSATITRCSKRPGQRQVIGVSSDTEELHQQFARSNRLPFILLSDKGGALRKRYDVPSTLGLLPGRVTYVIDKQGIVRHTFSSQFTPEKHIEEALHMIRQLTV